MQSKLYKRSTILLTIIVIIEISMILLLIKTRESWQNNAVLTILGFAAFMFLLTVLYSYYDLNADKRLIRKAVSNGDVALARIKDGSFVRFARDARFKNHVFWKLDVTIYDNDMKSHEAQIIEKFSLHQTSIPKGYVYVTYMEGKQDDSLIIPNVIIGSIPEYKVLTDEYEKALKPKYLNAYINDGLLLESYKESLNRKIS